MEINGNKHRQDNKIILNYHITHLPVIGVGGPPPAAAPPPAAPPQRRATPVDDPGCAGKPGPALSGLRFTAVSEVQWSKRDRALKQIPMV